MLMFWDALREAARRRQDKKSNIPSPNDCFSAKKNKNGNFFRRQKRIITEKKENIPKKSKRGGFLNIFKLLHFRIFFQVPFHISIGIGGFLLTIGFSIYVLLKIFYKFIHFFDDTFFELLSLDNVCYFLNNQLKRCFYMGGRNLYQSRWHSKCQVEFGKIFVLSFQSDIIDFPVKRLRQVEDISLFVVFERLLATGCLFSALQAELHNHPKSRIFHWQLPQLVLNIGLFFYIGSQLLSLYIRWGRIRDYGYLLFRWQFRF